MQPMTERPKAFITGASRGIGAQTAIALAAAGWDVALGYRTKDRRAAGVAAEVRALGARAIAVKGDLADCDDLMRVVAAMRDWGGPLDVVVLCASGGGADSPVALTRALRRQLSARGTVIYVTSHWAHLYGTVSPFPQRYEAIAASKRAAERALREMWPAFAAPDHALRLAVVSGGLVTGTFVGDQTLRRYPEFAERQAAIGNVVTAAQMGRRIAAVAADAGLPSGHTEIVGAPLAALRRPGTLEPHTPSQRQTGAAVSAEAPSAPATSRA